MTPEQGFTPPNPELHEVAKKLPHLTKSEIETYLQIVEDGKVRNATYGERIFVPHSNMPAIEFGGSPRRFKSTAISWLIAEIRQRGVKVDSITERPAGFDKRKYPVEYTLALGFRSIDELLRTSEPNKIALLDRSVYDRVAFLQAHFSKNDIWPHSDPNSMDLGQYHVALAFLRSFYFHHINGLILSSAFPRASLEVEGPRNVPGHVMTPDFLGRLEWGYRQLLGESMFNLHNIYTPKRQPTLLALHIDSTNVNNGYQFYRGKKPLVIQNSVCVRTWKEYTSLVLRTVGTICRVYTSGGIVK